MQPSLSTSSRNSSIKELRFKQVLEQLVEEQRERVEGLERKKEQSTSMSGRGVSFSPPSKA